MSIGYVLPARICGGSPFRIQLASSPKVTRCGSPCPVIFRLLATHPESARWKRATLPRRATETTYAHPASASVACRAFAKASASPRQRSRTVKHRLKTESGSGSATHYSSPIAPLTRQRCANTMPAPRRTCGQPRRAFQTVGNDGRPPISPLANDRKDAISAQPAVHNARFRSSSLRRRAPRRSIGPAHRRLVAD